MRLTFEASLHRIGETLREHVAPSVGDEFARNCLRLAGGLLNICANWADDAAAIRVEENAAIRGLLGEAAALVDKGLVRRLGEAARSADPGLRIGQLDAENHRLRLMLVEAHAALEAQDGPAPREMVQRIWRLLEDVELKRAPRE